MIELTKAKQTRITGKVVSRVGRRHRVLADDGRTLLADSAIPFNPGERVTLLADAIVGTAGKAPAVQSYQE